MASLINGNAMRERLQALLRTTARNGNGHTKSEERKAKVVNGKFSYASSFTRSY